MNFNFGEVLSRAWQIIWKHKVLWIFGILASCSQGGRGFNSGSSGGGGNGGTGPTNIPPQLERFFEMITQNAVPFIAIAVSLVCIFWLIAIFLGTIGRIGLIRGTWQVEDGAQNLVFGQLFSESTPYFWRLFGLSLLLGLPFVLLIGGFAAALIVFGISMSQGNDASAIGLIGILPILIGCLCLLIPVGIVINMIVRQAERAIVLENASVIPSLSRGWDVFRNHLGEIILMAIILGVIGLVAGFIIAIPVFIVLVPAVIAFAAGNGENWTPMIAGVALLCLYIPIAWLLNGIVISFAETAWTLTYMRLTGKPNRTDIMPPESGIPPSLDEGDNTIISSSHA
jgi:small-conductance mechanosensitive channel